MAAPHRRHGQTPTDSFLQKATLIEAWGADPTLIAADYTRRLFWFCDSLCIIIGAREQHLTRCCSVICLYFMLIVRYPGGWSKKPRAACGPARIDDNCRLDPGLRAPREKRSIDLSGHAP